MRTIILALLLAVPAGAAETIECRIADAKSKKELYVAKDLDIGREKKSGWPKGMVMYPADRGKFKQETKNKFVLTVLRRSPKEVWVNFEGFFDGVGHKFATSYGTTNFAFGIGNPLPGQLLDRVRAGYRITCQK